MKLLMGFTLAFALISAPTAALSQPPGCAVSPGDQAWLDRAMRAWNGSRRYLHLRPMNVRAIMFDDRCTLSSASAMNGRAQRWTATPHRGMVRLPDGALIPARVTSFAASASGRSFFVMAMPSLWRAGKAEGGPIGLDRLMIAVLRHEASHMSQSTTYGARMEALSRQWKLPESFNDDSIQERFERNADFSAAIAEETRLLLAAGKARDRGEAVRLARAARASIRARQARFYPASDAYLASAEDIWLTMEGSGQWLGARWLSDGGGVSAAVAATAFGTRGKWWSQSEGFALFTALTRLSGTSWQRDVFGGGNRTALEMLDEAVDDRGGA